MDLEQDTHQGGPISEEIIIGGPIFEEIIIGTQIPSYISSQNNGRASTNNPFVRLNQIPPLGIFQNGSNAMFLGTDHQEKQANIGVQQHYLPCLPAASYEASNTSAMQMSNSWFPKAYTSLDRSSNPFEHMSWEMESSYTELLLGCGSSTPAQAQFQKNQPTSIEHMGDEKEMFMITERYGQQLDNQGSEESEIQPSETTDEATARAFAYAEEIHESYFAEEEEHDSYEPPDWGTSKGDAEEQTENAEQEDENLGFSEDEQVQEQEHQHEHDQDNSIASIVTELIHDTTESNTNNVETDEVDELTQDDIRIFLENEKSVEAARSCSQEVLSHHVPHLDMIFDTEDQAYNFYNEYASICGFSIKKANNYKGKGGPGATSTRLTYRCNRAGKVVAQEVLEERKKKRQIRNQEKKGATVAVETRKRNRNSIAITGCEAKMIVTLKSGKWFVTNLDLQHNHELSPHDESKFLRSHKHMTEDEKLFIRTFNSVKLPTRKIFAILTYLRGGDPKKVPYNKKHVSNVRTAIRQENGLNDMMQVLEYFRKRQAENPRFYYAFKLATGNKVLCIFWADAFSRKMYELYGDCLSFDTTFKTNKYNLPFAPFVGVTGHGQNCLFACAILQNETIDTFEWLFQQFLDCMGGKAPVTIITDQCVSMRTAIPNIFPASRHINCFFHIKKKAEEKCGRCFAKTPNLHADFSDTLRNSLTVAEFEQLWQDMIVKYNVGHIKYFQDMWKYREKFVPVYFKKDFFPFIHSTARSEGTNSVFKDNVASTYSVISFLMEYQRISENIEESEREQDSITRITDPNYWLRSELEYQAGRLYNRKIFYRFQKQIAFSTKLHVDEVERHVRYEVYKTNMMALKDFRSRRYVVLVDLPSQDFSCICGKFQKDGLVCAHILRVLVQLNMSELPEKYYIERWRPKERKDIRHKQYNVPLDLTATNRHLRYTVLSRRLNDIASDGSITNEKYLFVCEQSSNIEKGLDQMTTEDELKEIQEKRLGRHGTTQQIVDHPDGYGNFLQNPDVAPSKGRPQTKGRQKTFMETLYSKQQITCSHCGSHEHNYATCLNKHLDKASFEQGNQKKKKNNKGKATTTKIPDDQPRGEPKAKQQRGKKKQTMAGN